MSGGFNPISMIAQGALAAATGGTSLIATLATQIATQIATQVAKQVIQQVGQQLGLPQSAISTALGAFDAATGNAGGAFGNIAEAVQNGASQFNFSPSEQGGMQRQVDNSLNSMIDMAMTSAIAHSASKAKELANESVAAGQAGGKGKAGAAGAASSPLAGLNIHGGFLVQLAMVMGQALDNKMNDLKSITDKINGISSQQTNMGEVTKGNMNESAGLQSQLQSLGAVMQGVSQEMKSLQEALSTTLKTVGETQQGLARKQ